MSRLAPFFQGPSEECWVFRADQCVGQCVLGPLRRVTCGDAQKVLESSQQIKCPGSAATLRGRQQEVKS
jgi:hypothetical protein